MLWFLQQPFIAVVLAYCAGITAAHADCLQVNIVYAGAGILLISLAASLLFKSFRAAGICVSCLFFCIGFYSLYAKIHPDPAGTSVLRYVDEGSRTVEAVVTEPPSETLNRTKLTLAVRAIHGRDESIAVKGNLLLSIKDCGRRFSYGDRIRFSSTLHIPRNFSNPGGFDYIRHLAYKSIYATAFLESDQSITLIREGEGNRFLVFIESIRNRIRRMHLQLNAIPVTGYSSCADYRGTGDHSGTHQGPVLSARHNTYSFHIGFACQYFCTSGIWNYI